MILHLHIPYVENFLVMMLNMDLYFSIGCSHHLFHNLSFSIWMNLLWKIVFLKDSCMIFLRWHPQYGFYLAFYLRKWAFNTLSNHVSSPDTLTPPWRINHVQRSHRGIERCLWSPSYFIVQLSVQVPGTGVNKVLGWPQN